jgi:hypothetical protein
LAAALLLLLLLLSRPVTVLEALLLLAAPLLLLLLAVSFAPAALPVLEVELELLRFGPQTSHLHAAIR